jgi:hypothetical protein
MSGRTPPPSLRPGPSIADPVPVGIAARHDDRGAEDHIDPADLLPIGGYVGITCGVAAWYVAFAHVTNATFGRDLIRTWPLR